MLSCSRGIKCFITVYIEWKIIDQIRDPISTRNLCADPIVYLIGSTTCYLQHFLNQTCVQLMVTIGLYNHYKKNLQQQASCHNPQNLILICTNLVQIVYVLCQPLSHEVLLIGHQSYVRIQAFQRHLLDVKKIKKCWVTSLQQNFVFQQPGPR